MMLAGTMYAPPMQQAECFAQEVSQLLHVQLQHANSPVERQANRWLFVTALSLILSSCCLNSAAQLKGMPSNALVSFNCTLVTCDVLNSVDVPQTFIQHRHVFLSFVCKSSSFKCHLAIGVTASSHSLSLRPRFTLPMILTSCSKGIFASSARLPARTEAHSQVKSQ